jgi:bacteriocin-like protein
MANDGRELSIEELSSVTGGGIVGTVLSDAEATTDAFLKRFAESSQRISAFINNPGSQASTAPNQE